VTRRAGQFSGAARVDQETSTMPLRKGRSQKTVSSNIKTLVHEYDEDGTIGTSHPASRKKAIKQAVAISMRKAGIGRK
jgi:hypothetical protein